MTHTKSQPENYLMYPNNVGMMQKLHRSYLSLYLKFKLRMLVKVYLLLFLL